MTSMEKRCFKCQIFKLISEFYTHPRMTDGHLGKCKTCTKKDVSTREDRLRKDPTWVINKRKRSRIKSAKRKVPTPIENRKREMRWRTVHPQKYKAHYLTTNAVRDKRLQRKPCEVCGDEKVQAHHDDYSKPLKVKWLCKKHHYEHHIKMREQLLFD